MKQVKLANVLFEVEDYLADDADLLYVREAGATCAYDSANGAFQMSGLVDFATYLNGISVGKWKKYAGLERITLHLEVKGNACTLALRALSQDDQGNLVSEVSGSHELPASRGYAAYDFDVPMECVIGGFAILTDGAVSLKDAYYYAQVDEGEINPVCLAICTTTFAKEEFIVPNIERIKAGVLGCEDEIADHFHMFVVDNGRTLDAEGLSDEGVTVIPNPNVGGAGGFARGMMAALQAQREYTHVILMDDDVRMLVESFKRLYALLSLATPEYHDACVNGAMLQLEHPAVQFEDVSYVRRIGGYVKVKPTLDVSDRRDVVANEQIDVEVESAYGAWWFSCIPVDLVKRVGLPLPFFIRCDDVEYGLRCKTKYMTMGGICVWHAQFAGRFNAAIVCYQYARNFWVTNALHECCDERLLMLQFWRTLHVYLRTMDYAAAELWLAGLEDFLKGPEFLMNTNGIEVVKANSAKAEKLVPIEELDQDVMERLEVNLDWLDGDPEATPLWYKVGITIPHDRHYFPDFMLSDTPGMLAPGAGDDYTPWHKTAMRKTLVAMSLDGEKAAIRTIDRPRYKQIIKRYSALVDDYRARHEEVARQYRQALPEMTSQEFWESYLARQ